MNGEAEFDQTREQRPKEREKLDFPALAQQFTQYTPEDLGIIWERNDDIRTVTDFRFFLYYCKQHKVDPVVGEVVASYRWNGIKRKQVLTPIVTIGVLRKRRASECDGLDQFQFTYNGNLLVTASGSIYRKGCARAFSTTVFYQEYAATTSRGDTTSMWRDKSHIMLSKCLEAMLTRLAFYDVCGELLIDEETQTREREISTENGSLGPKQFAVGRKTEPETRPPEPETPTPAAETPKPVLEPPKSETVPADEVRAGLTARFEAVKNSIGGSERAKNSIATKFWLAYLDVKVVPKQDLETMARAMAALEDAVTNDPLFLAEPTAAGERARNPQAAPDPLTELCKNSAWPESIERILRDIMQAREMNPDFMVTWILGLKLPDLLLIDVQAFLKVACLTNGPAALLDAAEKYKISPHNIVASMEQDAGKPISELSKEQIDKLLAALDAQLRQGNPEQADDGQKEMLF